MQILISNHTTKPIYEQITSQIKHAIMNGELKSGDPLPSMRALAKDLHISVITTQKAYEDLQRDGFIESAAGRGTFVSSQNKDSSVRNNCVWRKQSCRKPQKSDG